MWGCPNREWSDSLARAFHSARRDGRPQWPLSARIGGASVTIVRVLIGWSAIESLTDYWPPSIPFVTSTRFDDVETSEQSISRWQQVCPLSTRATCLRRPCANPGQTQASPLPYTHKSSTSSTRATVAHLFLLPAGRWKMVNTPMASIGGHDSSKSSVAMMYRVLAGSIIRFASVHTSSGRVTRPSTWSPCGQVVRIIVSLLLPSHRFHYSN